MENGRSGVMLSNARSSAEGRTVNLQGRCSLGCMVVTSVF